MTPCIFNSIIIKLITVPKKAKMQFIRSFVCLFLLIITIHGISADYQVGIGIADCTGPPAEINFMGYAKMTQKGRGLHLRQFSRAFIIEDPSTQDRVVFVTSDIGMMGHFVKKEVLKRLSENFGNLYTEQNVILSGTHTHGGPGGFLMDVLFDVSCLGHSREVFASIVDGIFESIKKAHFNKVPARIFLNSGILLNANINRSPTAYLMNPETERKQYEHDVDKELVQLKFVSPVKKEILGVLSWFPVHPTSMNNTNKLVTSDNVGYAAIMLENELNNGALPGQGKIVGAFASSNLGDVSPNIQGARCINTGEPCEKNSSTCGGDAKFCMAAGPGKDMFESTKIIAGRIFDKALEVMQDEDNAIEVSGPIKTIHQYIDMPKQEIDYTFENGTTSKVKGCIPAMGYSFAAGTTDGPGEFDFKQGTVSGNDFWNAVRDFIAAPSEEEKACHAPKPILLATGKITKPYQWQPSISATQIAMIGDVVIAAIPGEFTTMSGRRMKKGIKQAILDNGGSTNAEVIIAGLSNTYTDYITTPEEYQLQRYEAASTIYGPYTLPIYLEQYKILVDALMNGENIGPGPTPEDFSDDVISFVAPVILDLPPLGHSFGECTQQPPTNVKTGDIVTVKFISGHPRNNVMHGKTYLTVEKQEGENWTVIATDAVWETKFSWKRTIFASSEVTIEWEVTDKVQPGVYRIRHYGYSKKLFAGTTPYEGETRAFKI